MTDHKVSEPLRTDPPNANDTLTVSRRLFIIGDKKVKPHHHLTPRSTAERNFDES